jgi:Asp-tRNA(Asn)/Glu-tRNA(Gln) amidotransferase B subunit
LKESCIQAKKSFCESLNLRKTNYVIFPDWNESEESICEELVQVLKKLYFHPNAQEITLLIEIGNINEDDANHILSSAAMKIFWEENIEDDSEIQISLFSFNEMQWKWLIPCVSGYIHLFLENTNLVMKTNLSINNNFKLDDIKY